MSANKEVAIIGAGPAGLITGSILKKTDFTVTLFEQRDCLGGSWAIQPLSTLVDIRDGVSGIYSPTYPSLRCNLPKQVMPLPDFPFPDGYPLYARHDDVLSHLHRFAEHQKLLRYIRFNHRFLALDASSTTSSGKRRWQIQTSQGAGEFDAVVFCNSHYSFPKLPDLEPLLPFTGRLEHSFSYRGPEAYRHKRVALMGSGPSGEDLSREISHCASRVYLCAHPESRQLHRPVTGRYGAHNNLTRHRDVVASNDRTVMLEDGEKLENIDVLILCTGFQPDPAFRHALPGTGLSGDQNTIVPLYLNLFHPKYPELTATSMIQCAAPFILYRYQAEAIAGYLKGKIQLPNAQQRQFAAEQSELRQKGRVDFSIRKANSMEHINRLASMAGIPPPTKETLEILAANNKKRLEHPDTYRDLPWENG